MRAPLIAIEGLDRTGKTTQTNRLVALLQAQNVPCELVKFPQRETHIGKIINQYLTDKSFELNDQAAHLLFSANRWEMADQIERTLRTDGKIVILDRYVYSGVAYSSAKGLDSQWCLNPDLGLPKPDLTIFLKFNDAEQTQREGFGDERYEKVDFQQKVSIKFEQFYQNEEWVNINVDGLSIDEVGSLIWSHVEKVAKGLDKPVNRF